MRIVNTIGKIYDISAAIIDGRLHPESADWVIFRGLSSPTVPFSPASRFFFLLFFPLLFSVSGEKNGFSFERRGEGRQIELEICDSAVCKVFRFVSDSSSETCRFLFYRAEPPVPSWRNNVSRVDKFLAYFSSPSSFPTPF